MSATVSITIVGRSYEISCDEGQEDYVTSLAGDIDRRAGTLLRSVGQVGDARLLVMVALLMADEITELRRGKGAAAAANAALADQAADAPLADGIEAMARRIEAIAERLEKA